MTRGLAQGQGVKQLGQRVQQEGQGFEQLGL